MRRNGCPKGCFWRVRFFSAPFRFALKTHENLKGAERKRTLQKHPFGRPLLRTTPSPLLWRALNFGGTLSLYLQNKTDLKGESASVNKKVDQFSHNSVFNKQNLPRKRHNNPPQIPENESQFQSCLGICLLLGGFSPIKTHESRKTCKQIPLKWTGKSG